MSLTYDAAPESSLFLTELFYDVIAEEQPEASKVET